jgi:hypothetical protein
MVSDQVLGLQLNDGHSCSSQTVVQQMMTQWQYYEGVVSTAWSLLHSRPQSVYACALSQLCIRLSVCRNSCNQNRSSACTYVRAAFGFGMTGGAYLLLATLQQGAVLTLSCRRVVCNYSAAD